MKRLILALLLLMTLSGCGKNPESENVTSRADVYVEQDGILDLCIYSIDTLNPLVTSVKQNAEVLSSLYDGLFTVTDHFTAVPDLCTAYQTSEDGCSVFVQLKQNVVFSDGNALTAQDVALSVNRIVTSSGYYKSRLPHMLGAELTNNGVTIYFEKPMKNPAVLLDFPILSLGGNEDHDALLAPPAAGTGMYHLVSFRQNRTLQLVANQNHHSGKSPYFESVLIHITKTPEEAVSMLKSGAVDVLGATTETENIVAENIKTVSYSGLRYVFLGTHPERGIDGISASIPREKITPQGAFPAAKPVHPKAETFVSVFADSKQGPIEKNPIAILYCNTTPHRAQVATKLARELSARGIPTKAEGVDEKTYRIRIDNKAYDFFLAETEILPDFAEDALKDNTIGLYFSEERLFCRSIVAELRVFTLNPYKSIYDWKPYAF